jgi:hypothetical protein
MLRFGSLYGTVESERPEYLDALAVVFGVGLHPLPEDLVAGRHFDLRITAPDSVLPYAAPAIPKNRLSLGGNPGRPTITSDALHAELELDRKPKEIRLNVLRDDVPFPALSVHFVVMIHKILFYLERVVLHAAAVQVDGEVCVFVGEKGSGKSTTCLALARGGGTVLGEDQVVLHCCNGHYLVSGGDERSRVTERTERHFFAEPLAVAARDFAGTPKKEIRMGEFFRSAPFQDFIPRRLLFPKVGDRFQLQELKSQQALRRLLAANGHFQRFAGARDQAAFLDFLAGFVAGVSCWELSLSEDLRDLDRLAEQLSSV